MTPIFLHVGKLPKATMIKLIKAGYVPIEVTSLQDCQIVQPRQLLDAADSNAILQAALETIADAHYESVPAKFGIRLAKALSLKPK